MQSTNVKLEVDRDAALVLFELLARLEDKDFRTVGLQKAEEHALSLVLAALEKILVEPFAPEYDAIVAQARAALVERFGA